MTTKNEILDKLIEKLRKLCESTEIEVGSVSAAAIDAPGRNESRYDTSKVELGYLANSLSKKVSEIETIINTLTAFSLPDEISTIRVGSLVTVLNDKNEQTLFLLPVGGGNKLVVDELEIMVMSKTAPLFSAIINHKINDEINFSGRKIIIKKIV